MTNNAYVSAKDNWDNDTQPREREEILEQIGYKPREDTNWNELPKYVRKKLENMYADNILDSISQIPSHFLQQWV